MDSFPPSTWLLAPGSWQMGTRSPSGFQVCLREPEDGGSAALGQGAVRTHSDPDPGGGGPLAYEAHAVIKARRCDSLWATAFIWWLFLSCSAISNALVLFQNTIKQNGEPFDAALF